LFEICVCPSVLSLKEADDFFSGGGFFSAGYFESFFGFFDGCVAGADKLF